ncbi:helix-turn-helix domain-containing protein [Chitinophaga sp. 22321]|uniref:Helix-turn-helix transcriptional regulator n=1 Tax=Chitinophaga hostae TaxID=2831022 RepID=A0ABS5ISR7_9BACT|nr:helix-turn-helix transcriptional regulator [Chitinophaga hostae]MBS0026004.1 helix-turn-helix transcriptional regulator [Chitinophaga hostae]
MVGYKDMESFLFDIINDVKFFIVLIEFHPMASNRDENTLIKLGAKIRELKEAKGLTDRDFADRAEIGYAQVWRLLDGQVNPTYSTLKAIAKILDVHPGVFFDL